MSESETSSIEKAKASRSPATRFAAISGSVMRRIVRAGEAPRFQAASSKVSEVCWRPATAERTM